MNELNFFEDLPDAGGKQRLSIRNTIAIFQDEDRMIDWDDPIDYLDLLDETYKNDLPYLISVALDVNYNIEARWFALDAIAYIEPKATESALQLIPLLEEKDNLVQNGVINLLKRYEGNDSSLVGQALARVALNCHVYIGTQILAFQALLSVRANERNQQNR